MNVNFVVPFVDWPKRFLENLGPMMPSEGATAPWLFSKYLLYTQFEHTDPDFHTYGGYQGYLAQWAVEWKGLNPNTPVPTPA